MRKTDERGRAYFGDVGIGEGSGRVAPDENTGANRQGSAMELILVAEVAGLGDADAKCVLIGQYSYRQKDRCAVKMHSKLRDLSLALAKKLFMPQKCSGTCHDISLLLTKKLLMPENAAQLAMIKVHKLAAPLHK
jgi:hypothetical protein